MGGGRGERGAHKQSRKKKEVKMQTGKREEAHKQGEEARKKGGGGWKR